MPIYIRHSQWLNTLRPRQNGRHFPDDTFKRIFLNENVRLSIKISMNIVPWELIDHESSLVQIMAWRRPGDKPLSKTMMVSLLTHICVTRPQWLNSCHINTFIAAMRTSASRMKCSARDGQYILQQIC